MTSPNWKDPSSPIYYLNQFTEAGTHDLNCIPFGLIQKRNCPL